MIRTAARRRGYSQQVGGYLYTVYFLLIVLIGILKSAESRFRQIVPRITFKILIYGKNGTPLPLRSNDPDPLRILKHAAADIPAKIMSTGAVLHVVLNFRKIQYGRV